MGESKSTEKNFRYYRFQVGVSDKSESVRRQVSDHALGYCRELWGLDEPPRLIRNIENLVYESSLNGKRVFLRIVESEKRSKEEIKSELQWIKYLRAKGLSVCKSLLSAKNQSFVSFRESGIEYIACLFEEVKGAQLREKQDFSEKVFFSWGAYISRLQFLTQEFEKSTDNIKRKSWDKDSLFLLTEKEAHKERGFLLEIFSEIKKILDAMERSTCSYGLIHADLHQGNFFLDSKLSLTAIDFDDACFHWYAYDLAVVYFSIDHHFYDQKINLSFDYKKSFLEGYSQNSKTQNIINSVSLFYLYRTLMMHLWCKKRLREEKDCKALQRWCLSCRDWSYFKIQEFSEDLLIVKKKDASCAL